MKATFSLAILSLVAVAQAKYELSCAKSELSIRWPSYESNSEYYVCPRLFGRQMTVSCNPGEVFTFVLQSCTAPNRYIPAPALAVLPTASPLLSKPNESGYLTPVEIPNQPPVLTPPVIDRPSSQLPVKPATIPMAPLVIGEIPKQEETKLVPKEENIAIVEEPIKPMAPVPPTPAPTPPVVEKASSKKPNHAPGKKPTPKKKKSTTSSSTATVVAKKPNKKPSNASAKKTPTKKSGKQVSKADKTPKKSGKKPKTTEKKSPKV